MVLSFLDKFEQYVKLPEWLQMVGVLQAFGGLIAIAADKSFGLPLAFLGLGIAVAGRLYHLVYP